MATSVHRFNQSDFDGGLPGDGQSVGFKLVSGTLRRSGRRQLSLAGSIGICDRLSSAHGLTGDR